MTKSGIDYLSRRDSSTTWLRPSMGPWDRKRPAVSTGAPGGTWSGFFSHASDSPNVGEELLRDDERIQDRLVSQVACLELISVVNGPWPRRRGKHLPPNQDSEHLRIDVRKYVSQRSDRDQLVVIEVSGVGNAANNLAVLPVVSVLPVAILPESVPCQSSNLWTQSRASPRAMMESSTDQVGESLAACLNWLVPATAQGI